MNSIYARCTMVAFLAITALITGCKQPETIVVEESPKVATPSDTTSEEQSTTTARFRKLAVGEYHSISTLDPLFADNAAAMRAVQLVYEGLVRFNADGAVIPAAASRWQVSEDSLEYTFQLRPNVFYHDSDVFSTGTGRRLNSEDVKYIFERMAKAGVPPLAAHLFMNIKGFESYFNEQRRLYNPKDRQLEGISGIQTPTDSTVIFNLEREDPRFLEKLATPLAVIYPREAVGESVEDFSAVGMGPFTLSSHSDSTLIFAKFQDYYAASDIQLDRIDLITDASEQELFKALSVGNIYLLPQVGPQLLQNLLTDEGNLQEAYAERYNIQKTAGAVEFVLRYNPDSKLTAANARAIAGAIETDTGSYFGNFADRLVVASPLPEVSDQQFSAPENQVYTVFSEDPYVKTFLGNLSKTLANQNIKLQMMDVRTPTRSTGLFFTQNLPLIPDRQWPKGYDELFRFQVRQAALIRSEINGLTFNRYPWWFNPREISIPPVETLDEGS